MQTDENKIVANRFNETVINQRNLDAVDDLLSEDFVNHADAPGLPAGREGVKALFGMFHEAFDGCHVTIHDQLAEGDRVTTRKTITGTHVAPLFGAPATGREVHCDIIDIVRVADGRIVEHWAIMDQLALMQQLGALPQPAGA